ncbi:MAG: DUF971 domain-containing protein [Bacteroidetes bacterium]|nr:DUF971 domain-containing protein [Bacteroidota bacterium]
MLYICLNKKIIMSTEPKSIKKINLDELEVCWNDMHIGLHKIKTLRDECPCATCKGETVLLKTYVPATKFDLPGKYEIKNISVVGSYAMQILWNDGHDTGIYSWSYLQSLCECTNCDKIKSRN